MTGVQTCALPISYYIGLDIGDGDKNAYIFGGYYLEKINVQVQGMEFGTCWISLYTTDNEVKKEAFSDSYKNIISILSLGYEVGQTVFENEIYSSRLELEEYVFLNSFEKPAEISFLSSRGLSDIFYHVKYAPSALNRQPWRYLIKDNRILLYIENFENETDYLDSGVAMFYLKTLLEQDGIFSSWDIEAPEVDGVPETELFLIFFVDAGDDLAAVIAARHVLREKEAVLGVGDFVMD